MGAVQRFAEQQRRMLSQQSHTERLLVEFAREHLGSGKDIDDTNDEQKYGHIVGLNQRHKWGNEADVGSPLQVCARSGGVEACELLLSAGANVNFSTRYLDGRQGPTPLHLAIRSGSVQLVKLLLERGACRELKADMAGLPQDAFLYARSLANATPTADRIAISRLVNGFNMPLGPVRSTMTLTSRSGAIAAQNPVNYVKGLLGSGRNINEVPDSSPLSVVTAAGDLEAVRFLLAAGADVNKMDTHFGGPLHQAIKSERVDLVKVLLDAGADKHARVSEVDAISALQYAQLRSTKDPRFRVIRSLVEYHS